METPDISIAGTADIPQILEIKKQSHEFFVESRPDIYKNGGTLYTEDFLNDFFRSESKHVAIVRTGGHIAGYAFIQSVFVDLPMMATRKYVYIHDMAVLKQYRNKGIATGLLAYIEDYSLKTGAAGIELAVHLFCQEAMALYRKTGFVERTIRMEKAINVKR